MNKPSNPENPSPKKNPEENAGTGDKEALNLIVGVGHGTVIRINGVDDPLSLAASKGADLTVDFDFIQRGRASRYQIIKKLRRMVEAVLVLTFLKEEGMSGARWESRAIRDRRWMDKHLTFPTQPANQTN